MPEGYDHVKRMLCRKLAGNQLAVGGICRKRSRDLRYPMT